MASQHFRTRADRFFGAARDLRTLDSALHSPAIGLLAVHGCIALADAVLVAVEGGRGKGEDHGEAARRLRKWCTTQSLQVSGVKHFEWLLGKKNHFSYGEDAVTDSQCDEAWARMERFFAWASRTFPDVVVPEGSDDA